MKFNISYISAALMALTAFSACDTKDDPSYEPAEPTTPGERVYFESASEEFEVKDGENSVSIDIFRPESEKETTQKVEIEVTDESRMFTVPTNIVFRAGEVSAPVEIMFDSSALTEDEPYKLTIAVSELYANEYAVTSTEVTITRSNWSAWEPFNEDGGIGIYSFSLIFDGDEYPVRLLYRSNISDDNNRQYQLQWLDDYDDPDSWSTFMKFTSTDGGKTFDVPEQEFLEDEDYGTIYVSSVYAMTGDEADKGLSNFNEKTGTFTFNLIFYNDQYIFGEGNETFKLVGGAMPDESVQAHAPRKVQKH